MDLISVIIIGYNVEKYIEECLESVVRQTYPQLEIIFVDDGSTDRTAEIVQAMMKIDGRIRYFYQNNQGANSARKSGYYKASGKYIIYVDGDDYIAENTVENAYKKIVEAKADIVCFDYCEFDEKGIIYEKHPYLTGDFIGKDFLNSILKREQAHYLWNKMYTKEFLQKMKFESIPPITMGDDFAANVRMGVQAPHVIALKDQLYYYRKSSAGVSRKVNSHYVELNDMMADVEHQLSGMGGDYEELIEYNYFLNFYYYVVRNKYRYTYIQKSIYDRWKSKKKLFTKNKYIKEKIGECNIIECILIYSINASDIVEKIITLLYGILMRIINVNR